MDGAYWVGYIVGWLVVAAVGLALTYWVVRAAILSALAEDRRRVADDERIAAMLAEMEAERAARKAAKRAERAAE